MAGLEVKTLAGLLVEAEESVSNNPDPQLRFERLRLLEGINRYLSERTDLEDKLAVFRCLTGTIGLSEEEVGNVRNEYIAQELLNQGKLRGYGAILELMSLTQLDLPREWIIASADQLCKSGLFRKTGEDRYVTTNDAWNHEIRLIRTKAEEVDAQLGQIQQMRGRRDFGEWREHFRASLSHALEIGDLLRALGERRSGEDLTRRSTREVRQLGGHHAGPYIPNQARDYRTYFRSLMQGLPQPFCVDRWPDDK